MLLAPESLELPLSELAIDTAMLLFCPLLAVSERFQSLARGSRVDLCNFVARLVDGLIFTVMVRKFQPYHVHGRLIHILGVNA